MNRSAVFVLVMAAFGPTWACSAGDGGSPEEMVAVDDGSAFAAEIPHDAVVLPPAASPGNGNAGAGAPPQSEEPAPASDAPEAPSCTPTSDVDVPDDDFVDADCDGIDGERDAAIFVSPAGFDDAPGTPDAPVRSLNHALALASETGDAVYVCNGTYRESLEITAPVAVYGGYDCSRAWRRVKDWGVVESGVGVQLSVRDVTGLVHVERMAFRAPDAAAPGQSSQAALVVASTQVELVRVELATGNGAAGSDGKPGSAGTAAVGVSASGADAQTAQCSMARLTASCTSYAPGGHNLRAEQRCLGGRFQATRGGQGGRGGNTYLTYFANEPLRCAFPVLDPGTVGSPGEYFDGLVWRPVAARDFGRAGSAGSDGAAAALGIGELEAGVYVATNNGSNGSDGTHGMPGRGGAGGLGTGGSPSCYAGFAPGSGGGQGGAGGCAGTGASAGGGGGGALGIAIVDSHVSLVWPRFTIGNGGRGGAGAAGGAGRAGTPAGAAGAAFAAANQGESGQPGGVGGNGGAGGPGGGGPSIAILYSGVAPEVTSAVYSIGTPGAGGTSVSLGDAPPGVTGEVVSLAEVAP